jgi:hypothetical protein
VHLTRKDIRLVPQRLYRIPIPVRRAGDFFVSAMYNPYEFEQIQYNRPRLANACLRIIEFVFSRGGPQQFPRFVYWLGKENYREGEGDPYQNALVTGTRLSPHFIELGEPKIAEEVRWHDVVIDYRCVVDNSVWRFIADEWRMSLYRNRFIMLNTEVTTPHHRRIVLNAEVTPPQLGASIDKPETYFPTGFFEIERVEPYDAHYLDLDSWVKFITELKDPQD